MKTIVLACMVLGAAASAAAASGYADFNSGIAARTDHNFPDAIKFMSRALAAADLPAHLKPTALEVRALAYGENKQYELATADLAQALALRPADYDMLIERGALYGLQSKFDQARADFAAAIQLRPELDRAYVAHAGANIAESKFDDAIRDYNDAIATSPDEIDLILLRGEASRQARRYDVAIADFTAAIRKDSHYAAPFMLRGFTRLEAGDLRAAVSDYEDAVDLDPDDLGLRETAGIAQWDYGDYRAAERNFEKSAADPRDFRRVVFSQLWLHLVTVKRGRDDDGLAARAAQLDLKAWPGPVLGLYLGSATADAVFAAAKDGDADTQKDQLCEADFFVAEWHLGKKEDAVARPLLEEAVSSCRRGLAEGYAARTELGKLKP